MARIDLPEDFSERVAHLASEIAGLVRREPHPRALFAACVQAALVTGRACGLSDDQVVAFVRATAPLTRTRPALVHEKE